uniref:KIB1-4 beta-propeller domain-containing protein n=1 Tax=Oryza punctata TaxID=4537 RepID=A0A0E0JPD5_ORYPU
MADFPSWADLTDAVVREIANRLPCVYDRVHFAGVRRPWLESLERLPPLPPPPKLPYLILPLAEQPFFSCVLSGGATHPFFVPEWIRRACYFGSYDGGWAFLSTVHPQGYRRTFNLPNRIQLEREALGLTPEEKPLLHRLVIYTATLSSDPFMDGCVVAGLINDHAPIPGYRRRKIAFWRIEDTLVIGYFYMDEACWDAVDVVRHNGAFHFLTKGEHIIVGNPVFAEAGAPPQVQWEYRCFSSHGRGYDAQHVVARYLVESSRDLLMVVRCSPRPGELTSAFKVFRMAQPEEDDDALSLDGRTMLFVGGPCSRSDGDVVRYIWRELPSMEGRLLFVGRGCSRPYDAGQYPGFEGGIYFFDHRIAVQGGGAPALYPCSDCGKWTGKPVPMVERCFPEQDPSNYNSQVWLLNGTDVGGGVEDRTRKLGQRMGHGAGAVALLGYRDYFLTNLYQTLDTFDLPDRIQLDRDELVLRPRQKRLRAHHQRLFIDAATLSSDPFMDGCVVAGFINDYAPVPGYRRQKIAFWRIEDKLVIGYFYMEDACWDAVDVVRHDGAFHFLTNGEHIVVGNPGFNDEAEAPPQVEWEYRCFSSQGRGYDGQHVVARYLVESSGDLLMVVRCSPRPGELTSAFKVFRMAQPEEPEEDGDAPSLDDRTMLFVGSPCSRSDGDVVRYIWRELPSMEGRLLFVGRGCSRSYDADQYPGFEGGVYFFDHRIAVQGGGAPALYPCSDCGKWTGRAALQVERCFLEQDPSSYSSQVWLLNGSVRASLSERCTRPPFQA